MGSVMPEIFLYLFSDEGAPDLDTTTRILETVGKPVDVVISNCWSNNETKDAVHFKSLLEYGLYVARRRRLLINDRTVFLTVEETFLKIALILTLLQKDSLGSEDLRVSDVLDVYAIVVRGRGNIEPEANDWTSRTAREYAKDLKDQNQIDISGLIDVLERTRDDDDDVGRTVLFVGSFRDRKHGEVELCSALFSEPRRVFKTVPLDSSFSNSSDVRCDYEASSVAWEELKAIPVQRSAGAALSKDEKYTLQLFVGYLRLLVNSRDEMALSRVVCGPGGMLNHEAFSAIKRESKAARMPIYQTLVSYVQKLRLNGVKDAEQHPLFPYEKELTQFCELMDRLQDLLEDQKDVDAFVRKICYRLHCHIAKTSSRSGRWKMKHLDASLDRLVASHEWISKRKCLSKSGTPARSVANGGSVVGKGNLKAVRNVVDVLNATTLDTSVNLHKMLGMIEDKDTSVFETSLDASKSQSPGVVYPNILSLFNSPTVDQETAGVDPSLASRLGMPVVEAERPPPKKPDTGKPKFVSILAWAAETSPLVYKTPIRQEREVPQSPRPSGDDGKKDMLKKARHDAEDALQEARKCKKPPKSAPPKRSILKEINRVSKVADASGKHDEGAAGKRRYVPTGDENPMQANPPAKKAKVKQIRQIKGQTKLTAFFRM